MFSKSSLVVSLYLCLAKCHEGKKRIGSGMPCNLTHGIKPMACLLSAKQQRYLLERKGRSATVQSAAHHFIELHDNRDLITPLISAARRPPRNSICRHSPVFQYVAVLPVSHLTILSAAFLLECKLSLPTRCFHAGSSYEELTTALHFSALAGAYYVTRRRGQVSLHRDATILVGHRRPPFAQSK
jgi:hypothetical protein